MQYITSLLFSCLCLRLTVAHQHFYEPLCSLQSVRKQSQAANMTENKKMSMSRKHSLKSLMLQVARDLLEVEAGEKVQERKKYMEEHCPPLCLPSSKEELQALCKDLHEKIIVIDEERYNLEHKANMVVDEVKDLNIKIVDLKGKFKKPPLKKVRMSADAMLQALLGSKHKVNLDLRANLKQVKKEVKEEDKELRDVGDWRKSIEDKAGMGGRKKMFETEA
ncbi:troponin I type 2a (skeletal, fast), tandem duplicate 2 isoform X1 [Ictalurus furcatus]|uniref:troponin I type 2a (skeletal, fast), tandem duplicate 2 isoform X1 n=1 Tax=Ictalurus furcatus TaxID=66913 RepID=UPI00235090BE|nr:troponin I type 2a (skeletal, fast), tandem duplicate 2 isoform X1 [Ictalurus furcatus]